MYALGLGLYQVAYLTTNERDIIMKHVKSSRVFFDKTRRRIYSILSVVLLIGLLSNGCEVSSLTDSGNDSVAEQIQASAEKHGIDVTLINDNSNNNSSLKFESVDELNRFFEGLTKRNNEPIKKIFQITKNENGGGEATLGNSPIYGPKRLKIGTEDEGGWETLTDWFYNLTWLNVDVSWGPGLSDINVSSNPVGLTIFEFDNTPTQVRTEGSRIYFDIIIYGNFEFSVGDFNGYFYGSGTASGWIDTSTGESSLSANGYW